MRDALARHLNGLGVQTVISYPTALPFLPAYARFGHQPADFPNAHRNQSRILSIPIFPEMTEAQQQAVADAIRSFSE
jgi:dTDP-4-amino-4,6-dideoxygalactose transaminase